MAVEDSYLGMMDSSEQVELPPDELTLLLLLLLEVLLIQFFVRINCGERSGERLLVAVIDDLLLFSQALRRLIRGVVVVFAVEEVFVMAVLGSLCGGTFISFAASNDDLKAPVFDDIVVDDEKFKTFVLDIFVCALFYIFFYFFVTLLSFFFNSQSLSHTSGNKCLTNISHFIMFPRFEIFC